MSSRWVPTDHRSMHRRTDSFGDGPRRPLGRPLDVEAVPTSPVALGLCGRVRWLGLPLTMASVLGLLAACAPLDPIEVDVCGNGIVEAGEDCDRYADPDHTADAASPHSAVEPQCGVATDPISACRYVCNEAGPPCPDGWACGHDGLCRHAIGLWTDPLGTFLQVRPGPIHVVELDGDGRLDLLSRTGAWVHGWLGDGAGHFGAGRILARLPFLGGRAQDIQAVDLSEDGLTDLVAVTKRGLAVLLGTESSEFSAVIFADRPLIPPESDATAARVWPLKLARRYHHLVRVQERDGHIEALASDALINEPIGCPARFPGVHRLADLAGEPAIGPAARSGPEADENDQIMVLAFRGEQQLFVLRFGVVDRGPCQGRASLYVQGIVEVPSPVVDGVRLGDIDSDGLTDIIVGLQAGTAVALRTDDGRLGEAALDPRFSRLPERCARESLIPPPDLRPGSALPHLIVDLDGNGLDDFVTRTAIVLNDGDHLCTAFDLAAGATSAQGVDFNGDGAPDLAVINRQGGLSFVINRGSGTFHGVDFDLIARPGTVRVGDFDADGFGDVAYVGVDSAPSTRLSEETRDTLWVLFGSPQVVGTEPERVATFNDIVQLEVARFTPPHLGQTDDLVVVTRPAEEDLRWSVLAGSHERQFVSLLEMGSDPRAMGPLAVLAGDFRADQDRLELLVVESDRLWRIAQSGDEGLRQMKATPAEWPPSTQAFSFDCALWAVADLNGDPRLDELVAIDGNGRCRDQPARLLVLSFDAASSTWVGRIETLPSGVGGGEPHIADVDGDGYGDVLYTLRSGRGEAWLLWGSADGPTTADAVSLQQGGDLGPWAVTTIQADRDPVPEIALLGWEGIFVMEVDPNGQGRTLLPPRLRIAHQEMGPNATLRVADLDRDGLDDLVERRKDRTRVWLAVPGNPGAAR